MPAYEFILETSNILEETYVTENELCDPAIAVDPGSAVLLLASLEQADSGELLGPGRHVNTIPGAQRETMQL